MTTLGPQHQSHARVGGKVQEGMDQALPWCRLPERSGLDGDQESVRWRYHGRWNDLDDITEESTTDEL